MPSGMGNATAQDRLHTPMKVRQARLGHVSPETTMDYTHMIGDDDRRLVEQLDDLFCPDEHKEVLCATVRKSEEKALTPNTQGLVIQ